MRSSSEESSDDEFGEDMEALKRACQITGTNPSRLQLPLSDSESDGDGDGDVDDDLALARSIQKRFSTDIAAAEEPLTLKPLYTLPPDWSDTDDDCEDDFETLRAIHLRFSAYNHDGFKHNIDRAVHEVGDSRTENKSAAPPQAFHSPDADGPHPSRIVEWDAPGDDDVAGLPLKSSQFPKHAHAFVDAIKKNRSSQKVLRSKMMQMEARMEELKKLMDRVKILKDFQVACKKRTGRALSLKRDARVQLISLPKLRAKSKFDEKKVPAMCKGPPANPHVESCKESLATFSVSLTRDKWSTEEKENLVKGVKQQFQGFLLQRSVDLLSYADGSSGDPNDVDSIIGSIKDLDITPEKIRIFLPKVNWEQLAAMYVPGRSGAECQARFLNWEDPLINHNPWTAVEDKNLLHIIQQKGLENWIDIALLLGTNRTPFQCLARYQRSLNASILKREWTKEEDNQLRAAVESFGESNWQLVASAVEGRTGTQCSNRWLKTLHPARQRVGKWTSEEDKRLKVAVALFGPKTWKKVAGCVPGRTQVQCRERWVNCLDPSLNMTEWTEDEDSKLEAAIAEHGYCWSKVATCIPRRTDNQCWRRWKVLFPHEVPRLQAARKIQRSALISNFVDRESERPALGPNDFISPELSQITGSKNVDSSTRETRKSRRRKTQKNNIAVNDAPSGEVCSDEVPRLTNGSEVENMHCRSNKRKRRGKNTQSIKKEGGSDTMLLEISHIEEIRKTDARDGNPKRRTRRHKKGPRARAESRSEECEVSIPTEGCSLPPIDPNLLVVTASEELAEFRRHNGAQSKRASKLCPRRKRSTPSLDVAETVSEVNMDAINDHFSALPISTSSMGEREVVENVRGFKAKKKTPMRSLGLSSVGDKSNSHVTEVAFGHSEDRPVLYEIDKEMQEWERAMSLSQNGSLVGSYSGTSVIGSRDRGDTSFNEHGNPNILNSEDCSPSQEPSEVVEDATTLASFLQKCGGARLQFSAARASKISRGGEEKLSSKGKICEVDKCCVTRDFSIQYTRRKRRARYEACFNQMGEVDDNNGACPSQVLEEVEECEDDTTLASMYSKLKKRRTDEALEK